MNLGLVVQCTLTTCRVAQEHLRVMKEKVFDLEHDPLIAGC